MEIIKSVECELKNRLLIEIAHSFPFSIQDVISTHDAVQSFDATIKACECAFEMGLSSPLSLISNAGLLLPEG